MIMEFGPAMRSSSGTAGSAGGQLGGRAEKVRR
jgi:hypothetical protein